MLSPHVAQSNSELLCHHRTLPFWLYTDLCAAVAWRNKDSPFCEIFAFTDTVFLEACCSFKTDIRGLLNGRDLYGSRFIAYSAKPCGKFWTVTKDIYPRSAAAPFSTEQRLRFYIQSYVPRSISSEGRFPGEAEPWRVTPAASASSLEGTDCLRPGALVGNNFRLHESLGDSSGCRLEAYAPDVPGPNAVPAIGLCINHSEEVRQKISNFRH
jgi:hypothetical protein